MVLESRLVKGTLAVGIGYKSVNAGAAKWFGKSDNAYQPIIQKSESATAPESDKQTQPDQSLLSPYTRGDSNVATGRKFRLGTVAGASDVASRSVKKASTDKG
jgi:hypothetical protein